IQFAGVEVTLTPIITAAALLMLTAALWLFLRLLGLVGALLRFINGDDTALSRYFDRNRERKGFQALSEGMLALASGEGRAALAKAAKAEKYLQKPELTNLLIAQAAELAGDRRKAEDVYRRMLSSDATRFVGVRGIMRQKLADGETDVARQLAEKALALKPKHCETQDTLLQLQAQAEDWAGARRTLATKLKTGTLPRDVHKRRDAANRQSPDLIPAAVFAARAYIAQGNAKYAARVVKKAWQAQPHPDLAAAFAAIAPDESPQERIKRFAALAKLHPKHRETQLVEAELHLAAEDFPGARRALGDLLDNAPDARALTIMAAIEKGQGAPEAVVRGWLAKALTAPRGPQWVCDTCHNIHSEWAPVCENCHSFDTLSWRSPPAPETSGATGVEMLPLIIGALADKSSADAGNTDTPGADDVVDAEILEAETPRQTG
ncbi:MAG: heme biosynthesis protein HemY, partial [Lutimaribacter sp.]